MSNITKHEIALKLGFDENEKIYIVGGDDTYAIRKELKELGAKFNSDFKWYFSKEPKEMPEGYFVVPFSFDELFNYDDLRHWANLKTDSMKRIAAALLQKKGPSSYVYYPAAEKERLYNIPATLIKKYSFESYFGTTWNYIFTDQENHLFVWMTSKTINIKPKDDVLLTGTVKKFEEYNGEKRTYLTRCVIE